MKPAPITSDERVAAIEAGYKIAEQYGIDLAALVAAQIESERRFAEEMQ